MTRSVPISIYLMEDIVAKQRKRVTLAILPLEPILSMIGTPNTVGKHRHEITTPDGTKYVIKTGAHRLLLFKTSRTCAHCGIEGTHWKLVQDPGHTLPHINLHADDDMMLTLDHVIAKSKGGKNDFSNYQVLCEACNGKKADT